MDKMVFNLIFFLVEGRLILIYFMLIFFCLLTILNILRLLPLIYPKLISVSLVIGVAYLKNIADFLIHLACIPVVLILASITLAVFTLFPDCMAVSDLSKACDPGFPFSNKRYQMPILLSYFVHF